jgi:5-methylcytosine-specific restriction endonuclease McrA
LSFSITARQLRIARKEHLLARWRADKRRCIYCRKVVTKRDLTIDHLIPRAKGGTDDAENRVHCCLDCNHAKADLLPLQFVLSRISMRKKGIAG